MNVLLSQRIGEGRYDNIIDSLESEYVELFSSFGMNCFPVSNFSPDIDRLATQLPVNGIILTGGNDVEENNAYIKYRNNVESALIKFAIENQIPLLGICRGMQYLYRYFGGGLKKADGHVRKTHAIGINSDVLFKGINLEKDVIVNSYHNSILDESTLPSELKVIARCKVDNSIEAVAHCEYPLFGIMWHPERDHLEQNKEFNRQLLDNFIQLFSK